MEDVKHLYIVVTQSGSFLSALLKVVTGAQYNHVSVSLDRNLDAMYSFGRRRPYNPFWGGFVQESPHWGTFKRFPQTEAVVVCLDVTAAQYDGVQGVLADMYQRRTEYRYNVLGLLLAAFRIQYRGKNSYYCSQFVKELLTQFDVIGEEETNRIPQPVHFLRLKNGHTVYEGKLSLYPQTCGSADQDRP